MDRDNLDRDIQTLINSINHFRADLHELTEPEIRMVLGQVTRLRDELDSFQGRLEQLQSDWLEGKEPK